MKSTPRTKTKAGFTLLEVLVLLVLLSLVTMTLAGSLGPAFDLPARLMPRIERSEQEALAAAWFRSAVRGLYSDATRESGTMTGDRRHLSGFTLLPPDGEPGTPVPMVWTVNTSTDRNISVLSYMGENGVAVPILHWAGGDGGFSYLDAEGRWHDEWPGSKDTAAQLPRLVRLEGMTGAEPWLMLAAPGVSADRSSLGYSE